MDPTTYLTTMEVATRLSIDTGKVLDWIHARELVAVNIAQGRTGKPRWRIAEIELEAFLARRANRPAVKAPRSRRAVAPKEYY